MTHVKHSQLFAIALPMILSNITVPLLGLVDTAVLGHLDHAYYLGGSTVGAMLITFVTWLCGFLRMSTTGLSAHAYGAKDEDARFFIFIRGLSVAFIIGAIIILLQQAYISGGLWLAGGSEQVQFYAREYAEIRVWGLPAALANIVIIGWLLGQHQAKKVMWLLVTINLINLLLDLIFVLYLDMQVRGVAYATLIAELSGLILGLQFVLKQLGHNSIELIQHTLEKGKNIFERKGLLAYFKLNRDILIRTLCLEVCFVFMTFQGARLGDDIVAANAILMNFLLLISFGLDGIANGAEVLVGKAKGEKQEKLIEDIVKLSLFWTAIFALAYSLFFFVGGSHLIRLISSIPNVIGAAEDYFTWIVLLPLISCWCYLFDGIYIGLMNARIMRNSMLISTFACFFPTWLLFNQLGNHGLWLAFSCFMISRGLTLAWHFYQKERLTFTR